MKPLESELKVSFCDVTEFETLAKLYQKIAEVVSNRAFFNWTLQSALDELPKAKSLVIKSEKNILAFVTFRDYEDRLEIMAIGTDPTYLRNQMAQKVLDGVKTNAAQRKLSVWLEVHENNQTAVNLYLKNGFKVLNSRKRYYPDGGNALVMQFIGD